MKCLILLLGFLALSSARSPMPSKQILGFRDDERPTGSMLATRADNSKNCKNNWKVWKRGSYDHKDELNLYGVQTKSLKINETTLDFNGEFWLSTTYGPIEWPQNVYNQLTKMFGSNKTREAHENFFFDTPSFKCVNRPTLKIEIDSKTIIELKEDEYIVKDEPDGDCQLKGEIGRNNSRLVLPRSFLQNKCLRFDARKNPTEMALSDRVD